MSENVRSKQVFVGLSGGVDSAVTAVLLKEAGARVTGVFIKGAYPEGLPCTWAEDRRDAMRVAAKLGIPFVTLDGSEAYRRAVIDYLVHEYAAGRTPNPDIMCNRDVKFGIFYEYALQHGANFIATGHYARIGDSEDAECAAAEQAVSGNVSPRKELPVEQHIPYLLRGVDKAKDQSYFLWAIKREVLPHILFPLGSLQKADTRSLAHRFQLPVADKRDSQGICFLGNVSIEDFLRAEVGLTEGVVVSEDGKELGKHRGAIAYTLGERVPLSNGPWYVVKKDIKENVIVVSHEIHEPGASSMTVRLTNANWQQKREEGKVYDAQYRYHGAKIQGTLSQEGDLFVASKPLSEPLAPGQSLVVYDGDTLIGGGIIA